MTYKELRIGNYILQDGEEIHGIVGLTIYKFSIGQIILEPIPITEEWLLKFGFEKNAIGFWWRKHPNPKSRDNWDGWYLNKDGELTISLGPIFVRIQYIHQLQNLFFTLTGKELIINN